MKDLTPSSQAAARWMLAMAESDIALDQLHFERLRALWFNNCAYYGVTPSDDLLDMYAQDCLDLAYADVAAAFAVYRRTPPPPGHKPRAPLPVDIINQLSPHVTHDAEATELAARIWGSITTIGYTYPQKAQAALGPIPWQAVVLMGGWVKLCQTVHTEDRSQVVAQLRDVLKSLLQRQVHENQARMRKMAQGGQDALSVLPKPVAQALPEPEPEPAPDAAVVQEALRLVAQRLRTQKAAAPDADDKDQDIVALIEGFAKKFTF